MSVPMLLAQCDGLIIDSFNASYFSRPGGQPEVSKLNQVKELLAQDEERHIGFMTTFLIPFTDASPLRSNFKEWRKAVTDSDQPRPLSRNAVVHGIDSHYGTHKASSQVILLADYLIWAVDELSGNPSNDSSAGDRQNPE